MTPAKGKVLLKLNGATLNLNAPSPSQQKLLDALAKLPIDEVFTTSGLTQRLNITEPTLSHSSANGKMFDSYRLRSGKHTIWGHPQALKEYARLVAEHGGGE